MCGIAGQACLADGPLRQELARAVVAATERLEHRGPDGHGLWQDPSGALVLGHRRLSIVDPSDAGAQPMVSHDGRWVLTFNGEIYGHRELRKQLESHGCRFRGTSDTEVLLEGVALWGVSRALERVNGMYALGVWDTHERELWLARDPVGEKPLYVWDGPAGPAFASELGALRAFDGVPAEIDECAAATYLQLGYVPAPLSIYQGVSKLEAGEWRRYRADGSMVRGTTTPAAATGEISTSDLLEVLTDAVAIRTIADVPVGVFLSGGIDSTIVAALAARAGTTHTFTASFGQASHDESVPAARVAEALGTIHTELPVSAADGLALVEQLPAIYGEPFGDPSAIPTYLIAAEAKGRVGVALTGDGGDELFGGYNRLTAGAGLDRVRRRVPTGLTRPMGRGASAIDPRTIDRWGARARRAMGRAPIPNLGEKVHKAAAVLGASATVPAILALVAMWSDPGSLIAGAEPLDLGIGDGPFSDELFALDRRLTLPEQMLTKVDRATMRVALEARPPLLDPRVVAIATQASLDAHMHRGQGKQLLRSLVPQLIDPALLDRPKMGFDPPYGSWLRGPLRMWADGLLSPDALRATGISGTDEVARSWSSHLAGGSGEEQRLWTLLQYQAWHQTEHQRRPPPAPIPPAVRAKANGIELRPATPEDQPSVLALVSAAMQSDPGDERFEWLLQWKHQESPFGASPAWVAESDGEVVGYRAFLRWRFRGNGRTWNAVRAVDTATHPEHQGKGIFRSLTLHALEELRADGIDFVFNTPNDQSRPGYLKMGWQLIGQLTPWVRPASPTAIPRMVRGRTPAAFWGEPTDAGITAAAAFDDEAATASLLSAAASTDGRLSTARTPAYLRWRYPAGPLGYRVLPAPGGIEEGAACFRLRRRGAAVEATVGDLLVPGQSAAGRRALLRSVLKATGADYALVLGGRFSDGLVPLAGQGPTFVWRDVVHTEAPPADAWNLTMGDIELF